MTAAQRASGPPRAAAFDLARPGWVLDLLFVLSIWNLDFMRGWREMIFASAADQYWMPLPQRVDYIALVILVLGGAALSFLVLRAIRRHASRFENILFLVFTGAISLGIGDFLRQFVGGKNTLYLAAGLAPVILALLLWQRSRTLLARAVYIAGLVMVPFAVSNLLQAAWHIAAASPPAAAGGGGQTAEAGEPATGSTAGGERPRVLWLLFDELDERALFGALRGGYDFETFDQFRAQSVHYTRATGAGGLTVVALPSLWLGTRVTAGESVDADTLMVTLDGAAAAVPLDDLDHLFGAARDAGIHTALVGYYHPYCRIFAGDYDSCETYYYLADPRIAESRNLGEALAAQISVFDPLWYRRIKIEEFRRSVAAAAATAADPRFDLVAVHAGFPHSPWVFDAKRKQLSLFKANYLDNIAAADRYLALVRQAMQESGVWDRTAVIITADHGNRDWKGDDVHTIGAVPFLLKLPHQRQGRDIDCDFDVIVLRRLIEGLLRGEVPGDRSLEGCLRSPS
ncbi:MAG: sulfatase-like hydrolase/transferase [Dongiaceae bacterium]